MTAANRRSRRAAKVGLVIALVAIPWGLYFALFYGWLTATPVPAGSIPTIRNYAYLNFGLAACGFIAALWLIWFLSRTRQSDSSPTRG